MKRIFYSIFIIISLLLISSCSNDKHLNIDYIFNNGNCIITKLINNDSNKVSSRLIIDNNYVAIEETSENMKYDYYIKENNKIYVYKNLKRIGKNINGLSKEKLDTDKYGIGNDLNKLKKLIQLSFIYTNIDIRTPLLDDLYNSIMNNTEITKTFNKNLTFYENVRNYYDSVFPIFNNEQFNYKINNYSITLENNYFKNLNYNNIYLFKAKLSDFEKEDLSEYWEFKSDKYLNMLSDYIVNVVVDKDNDYLKYNSNYKYNKYIRIINVGDDINKLKIKEYKSKKDCQKAYDDLMENYILDELYFAIVDECLFITTLAGKDLYENILGIKFKLSDSINKYSNSKNYADEEYCKTYSSYIKVLEDQDSKVLINSNEEYDKLIDDIKEITDFNSEISEVQNRIDNFYNLIKADFDFNKYKYLIIQSTTLAIGRGHFNYILESAYVNDGKVICNICVNSLSQDANKSYYYMILKLDKDIDTKSIIVNYNLSMPYFFYDIWWEIESFY